MNSNLVLGLLILVGFWGFVFWVAVRWAKKHNRAVGRTVWQGILWAAVVSAIVRVLERLSR